MWKKMNNLGKAKWFLIKRLMMMVYPNQKFLLLTLNRSLKFIRLPSYPTLLSSPVVRWMTDRSTGRLWSWLSLRYPGKWRLYLNTCCHNHESRGKGRKCRHTTSTHIPRKARFLATCNFKKRGKQTYLVNSTYDFYRF